MPINVRANGKFVGTWPNTLKEVRVVAANTTQKFTVYNNIATVNVTPSVVLPPPSNSTIERRRAAINAFKINSNENDGRVLHGPNPTWGIRWPEVLRRSSTGYTEQAWPPIRYMGEPTCRLLPWGHVWEMQNSAWGAPHNYRSSHEVVASFVNTIFAYVFFTDTNRWEAISDGPPAIGGTMYDGYFGSHDWPANQVHTSTRVPGLRGTRMANPGGITSPDQVRQWHFWSTFYTIPESRYNFVEGTLIFADAWLEPVNGGHTSDLLNTRYLANLGGDPYPLYMNKEGMPESTPDKYDGYSSGRPTILTGDTKTLVSAAWDYAKYGENFFASHPVPDDILGRV